MVDLYSRRTIKGVGIRNFEFEGTEYIITYEQRTSSMTSDVYYAVPRIAHFENKDGELDQKIITHKMRSAFVDAFNEDLVKINNHLKKKREEVRGRLNGDIPDKYKRW